VGFCCEEDPEQKGEKANERKPHAHISVATIKTETVFLFRLPLFVSISSDNSRSFASFIMSRPVVPTLRGGGVFDEPVEEEAARPSLLTAPHATFIHPFVCVFEHNQIK
jgi:hypothetical protein